MKIGVFFFVDEKVVMDAVPVERGNAVGDTIQYGNHYEFWNSLQPKTSTEHSLKEWPYYTFPRGKVVYVPAKRVVRIYADPCLVSDNIASVIEHFGCKDFALQVDNMGHYQCARCNEYFDVACR